MKRILIALLLISVISSPVSSVRNRASYISPASPREATIHLNAGTNLVGIPVDPGGWRLSELAEYVGDVNLIVSYNTEEKKFDSFLPSTPEDSPTNVEVEEGKGYLIMMREEKDVTFTGTSWSEDGFITLDLKMGLNMVSIPLDSGTEYDAKEFFDLTSATLITRYDDVEKKFKTVMTTSSEELLEDTPIDEGKGYIVSVREDEVVEIPTSVSAEKPIFLISDENWKDILSLVPVTTWTTDKVTTCAPDDERDWCWCNQLPEDYINLEDKGVCAYPTLIYHREDFDYLSHSESIVSNLAGLYNEVEKHETRKSVRRWLSISGDVIVWNDIKDYSPYLYMYDLSTGETGQITDTSHEWDPVISGDRLLWHRGWKGNIYMCDLRIEEGEEGSCYPGDEKIQITTNSSRQDRVAISGDMIVWLDDRTGNYNVYVCDITNAGTDMTAWCNTLEEDGGGLRQITADSSGKRRPAISGSVIVWSDLSTIYMCDLGLEDGEAGSCFPGYETPIADISSYGSSYSNNYVAISGNIVVWDAGYTSWNELLYDTYMCDLSIEEGEEGSCTPGSERQINSIGNAMNPEISGDKIVWQEKREETFWSIYMCDLSIEEGEEGSCYLQDIKEQIAVEPSDQIIPAISGDNIVWLQDASHGSETYSIHLYSRDGITVHQDSFDADSIIYFIEQYYPREKIEIITEEGDYDTIELNDGEWQSFIARENFLEWIEIYSVNNIEGYQIQLKDENENIIFESDTCEYNFCSFNVNKDVEKGGGYKIVFGISGAGISFKTPVDVDYPDGELSKDPSKDLMMGVYFRNGDDLRLTIIGETPRELDDLLIKSPGLGGLGLAEEQIRRKYPSNYLDYWDRSKSKDMVYVEDNYEIALMASTYASLINAPLIVEGSSLDDLQDCYNGEPCVFDSKEVILVGSQEWLDSFTCPPKATCDDKLTLRELQERYISLTDTDKIILTNSDDLDMNISEYLKQDKSMDKSFVLYSGNSLGAPVLASAKHELILSTTSTGYQDVDAFIEDEIDALNLTPEYLTIVASPNAIEMSFDTGSGPFHAGGGAFHSADAYHYSKINEDDQFLDMAVGRIFGLTTSDTSSYMARSLFYEETLKNEDKILATRGDPSGIAAANTYAEGKVLSATGYQVTTTPKETSPEDWKDKFVILYHDHGNTNWAGIYYNEIPYLDSSFVYARACLTCAFKRAKLKPELFCANIIRKGGVGYIGTTDSSARPLLTYTFLAEMFAQESRIGKAFINSKNSIMVLVSHMDPDELITPEHDYYGITIHDETENPSPWYTLLGDPTLRVKTIHTMPKPQLNFVSEDQDGRNYKLIAPAMKIEIPEDVKNLCVGDYKSIVDEETPIYFITAHKIGDKNTRFIYNIFDSLDGFEPVAVTNGWSLINGQVGGEQKLWIISPENPYFTTANDYEFTNFEFDIRLTE